MDLLFGSRVRSASRRMGSLAGVEIDAQSRRVTKIIFSDDGKLGSHAQTRSIEAVRLEGGTLMVGEPVTGAAAEKPLLLSRAVRVSRGGHQGGHVTGVAVGDRGMLEAIVARHHWWTGRSRLPAGELDFSQPGEVRVGGRATQAA